MTVVSEASSARKCSKRRVKKPQYPQRRMVPQTRQMRIGVAMFVIATALAVLTSDALPLHWQIVAWTAAATSVVYWLNRRFPKAWLLPGSLGPICMWISSSYNGPSGSLTFYQNTHDLLVFFSVFAAVAIVFECLMPRGTTRPVQAQ